jgi:hypothetical protein
MVVMLSFAFIITKQSHIAEHLSKNSKTAYAQPAIVQIFAPMCKVPVDKYLGCGCEVEDMVKVCAGFRNPQNPICETGGVVRDLKERIGICLQCRMRYHPPGTPGASTAIFLTGYEVPVEQPSWAPAVAAAVAPSVCTDVYDQYSICEHSKYRERIKCRAHRAGMQCQGPVKVQFEKKDGWCPDCDNQSASSSTGYYPGNSHEKYYPGAPQFPWWQQ